MHLLTEGFIHRSQPRRGPRAVRPAIHTGQAVGLQPPRPSGLEAEAGEARPPKALTLQLLVHNSQALLKGNLCLQQGVL